MVLAWLSLVSIIYLLYIWNNISSFIKRSIPGLFIRGKQILRFLYFLKNPLWIIVILLIVMNFLLWNISQRIGHDYIYIEEYKWLQQNIDEEVEKSRKEGIIPPTGLYRTIYNTKPKMPYFELNEIIDKLDDIYWKL